MSDPLPEPLLINTGSIDNPVPVSVAIMNGYAPDNELYTFAEYPTIMLDELALLQSATYAEIFHAVTRKFLAGALPEATLKQIAEEAYSRQNFDFDEDGNLRFTTLPSGVRIVGLSDGPTAAFKDMAMQPMARWMSHFQRQKGDLLTILLSTSGDTGPAALHAFGGLPDTEIIGMLPHSGVSKFQWSQMAELGQRPGVHVLEVAGDFSEINDLHMEADLVYDLASANSVNIARIIAQVPYYAASYLKAIRLAGKKLGDPVDVSVPSGNFGNTLSAIIARKMGVPLRNIIVATNENNILDTLFREGIFKKSEFQHTDSSAQDIRMPSNIWRYFGILYRNDPKKISELFQQYKANGSVKLTDIGDLDESSLQGILSVTVRRADRARTIRKVFDESGSQQTIIDPHTANGVAAIEMLGAHDNDVPMLAMETAKPFKFDETVSGVLGMLPPRPDRFKALEATQAGRQLTQIGNLTELLTYLGTHTHAKK